MDDELPTWVYFCIVSTSLWCMTLLYCFRHKIRKSCNKCKKCKKRSNEKGNEGLSLSPDNDKDSHKDIQTLLIEVKYTYLKMMQNSLTN